MSTAQAVPSSGRSVFQKALQGTVIYSIPLVGQRIASIFLLSIVTRVLTTEDFGMLSLLEQVSAVLSMLLGGHFAASIGYFYFHEHWKEDRNRVVGTATGGALLLGSIAALICWPLAGILARHVFRSNDALRYLPIVFACMPLIFLTEALLSWLRVADRQMAYASASLVRLVLTVIGISVLVGVFRFHVMGYLITTFTCLVVLAAVLGMYLFRFVQPQWSSVLFRRMLLFSLPIGVSMIAMFFINFGDQFVLRQYRSLSDVGIYSLAYRIGMIVSVAYSSFHSYWSAQVYQIVRRDDSDRLFARLFTYAVLLLSSAGLVLVLGARPGLRVLVAPAFQVAAPLIPVLVAANSIRALGEFLRCLFLAAGKPSYEAYCDWGGMAVCGTLYFLLIPRYGMWGGALATLVTFVVMGIASVIWTYKMKPYRVEGIRLLKLGSVLAVILVLYYAVPVSSLPAQIAWSAILLVMFPVGLCALRFPNAGEWEFVHIGLRKITRGRLGVSGA